MDSSFDDLFRRLDFDSSSFVKSFDSDFDKGISYSETVRTLKKAGSEQPERTANYLFRTANKNKDTGEITINECKGLKAKEKGNEFFNWMNKDFDEFLRLPDFDMSKKLTFGQLFDEFHQLGSIDPFRISRKIFKQMDRDFNAMITGNEIKDKSKQIEFNDSDTKASSKSSKAPQE